MLPMCVCIVFSICVVFCTYKPRTLPPKERPTRFGYNKKKHLKVTELHVSGDN